MLILILILLCQSSLQQESKDYAVSEDQEQDPCIYTYEAFQPNLSSIKEKVALITVNRCEQKDQARKREKRKKSKKKKQNKDSKRVLKSLESGKSKRKKHQTYQNKRKKKKKKKKKKGKKKRSKLKDRRGKVHREFKDWKRFVGTGLESIRERFGKREDKLLASLLDGSSKWKKLLKHRKTMDQPQHISHHLG